MSKLKLKNPYAFPCEKDEPGKGMTLRDYFAAKAMQGLVINFKGDVSANYDIIATVSYKMADEMLKQREI
jgi:hypothetical protein